MRRLVALLIVLISVGLLSCTAKYKVVGCFDDYNEVFIGDVTSNLLTGTGHVVAVGKNSKMVCEGDSVVTYIPRGSVGCAGQRGKVFMHCTNGSKFEVDWIARNCTTGYGEGVDKSTGVTFHFVFGLNEESAQQEFAKLSTSVSSKPELPVYLPQKHRKEKGFATGTGFFVTNDGVLVTNHHVVDGAKEVNVLQTVEKRLYPASILAVDPVNDVAILKIDAKTNAAPLATTCNVAKGHEVLTLGYPLVMLEGQEQKATFGRVNALSGPKDDLRLVQIDVPIQPGNSGGPLINKQGEVVGVVTSTLDQLAALRTSGLLPQNVNFAVKIDYILPALRTALKGALPSNVSRSTDLDMAKIVALRESSIVLIVAK
jgi:S1-C subfamily serine protease